MIIVSYLSHLIIMIFKMVMVDMDVPWCYLGGGGVATKSDTDMAQVPRLTNELKKIIRLS